ncbi:hypothetical protein EYF80_048616 [Liparis tanakae]|uniref:Uncharacterized protein n=1 Tax=Liparis tanakae TaxID=230148 RepID=A0A4Z2FJT0_9TELE|nr:hypothetical protein EYF80_048616 [Liparis tanakae]
MRRVRSENSLIIIKERAAEHEGELRLRKIKPCQQETLQQNATTLRRLTEVAAHAQRFEKPERICGCIIKVQRVFRVSGGDYALFQRGQHL